MININYSLFTCTIKQISKGLLIFCRYHGEKISRKSSKPRTADRQAIISTVYDSQEELQKSEPLLRRHDHYTITYRDPVQFKKAEPEKS